MRGVRPAAVWGVGLLVAVSFALYSAIGVLDWWRYDIDSFDLAIYHQVVWHLSRFEAPAVSLLSETNYFGDHFSPILVLWAPLYWLTASPAALVAAQALLIAASIPAIYLYGRTRVGERCALLIAFAYSLSWGVLAAVDFAVHEVAFAAPLLAWGVYLADRERWAGFYACMAGLLLVKEDYGLTVAALGIVLALSGQRRRGLLVAAGALVVLVVVNELVMPALNGGGWSVRDAGLYGRYGDSASGAAIHLATHPVTLASALADDPDKVRLLALLAGAFAGLSLLSPLVLVAVPQVVERLLANDSHLWSPSYQYSLVPMVILALAASDGGARLTRRLHGRSVITESLAWSAVAISVLSAAAYPLDRLVHRDYWRRPAAATSAAAAVGVVPSGVPVAGDRAVLTHLPARDGMYLTDQLRARRPGFALLRGDARLDRPYKPIARFGDARVYALGRPG